MSPGSGEGWTWAQTRRSVSVPSAWIAKAVKRAAKVSATISVPSSVMTMPLGNQRSSATTLALPSGSTRTSPAVAGSPPPMMSKPKSPAYAKPCRSTIMSLRCPPVSADTSACTATVPSEERRSTRRSFIDTTSRSPPGIHPSPEGWPSTSTTVSSRPSAS